MQDFFYIGLISGGLLGAAIGGVGVGFTINSTNNSYPKTDQVQFGYAVPSRLEVELVDLDGNGEIETTLKYEGKRYLLHQNEEQLMLEEYKLK